MASRLQDVLPYLRTTDNASIIRPVAMILHNLCGICDRQTRMVVVDLYNYVGLAWHPGTDDFPGSCICQI